MKSLLSVAALGVLAAMSLGLSPTEPQPLFDGESFTGWEGEMEWFRIEDEAIVAGTHEKPIPNNEFLCTETEYEDFELSLEVKIVGGENANAGIQIRSKRVPDHHEVSGYQADMGQGYWGALYDESRRNKILAQPEPELVEEILKPGEWNHYLIRCEGDRVQLWLNGRQTVDYVESDPEIARKGLIGLQVHSGPPMEAWYRNIKLTEL